MMADYLVFNISQLVTQHLKDNSDKIANNKAQRIHNDYWKMGVVGLHLCEVNLLCLQSIVSVHEESVDTVRVTNR